VPDEPILRQLPGVVDVEVVVRAEPATHRIIHLRDWHYVPRDLYAQDVRAAAGRPLSEAEVDRLHEELCLEVEAVQFEHLALLRCLIKHHGLRRVYGEGLTEEGEADFQETVEMLRDMEQVQVPEIRRQLAEVRGLKRTEKTAAVEKEIVDLLEQHRKRMLEIGTCGRLQIAGDIACVRPLDNAGALARARPFTRGGSMRFEQESDRAREDLMVKAVTKDGDTTLCVGRAARPVGERASCWRVRVYSRNDKEVSRALRPHLTMTNTFLFPFNRAKRIITAPFHPQFRRTNTPFALETRRELSRTRTAVHGHRVVPVSSFFRYPRSVKRRDGKVVTVYYFHDEPDGARYVGATIWDPGKVGR
jgi:hypothetical protein